MHASIRRLNECRVSWKICCCWRAWTKGREPKFENIDLTELLVESVSDMQAAARDHIWRMDVPDEPVEMIADRSQIQQVI